MDGPEAKRSSAYRLNDGAERATRIIGPPPLSARAAGAEVKPLRNDLWPRSALAGKRQPAGRPCKT
jgi:hypothetical protein